MRDLPSSSSQPSIPTIGANRESDLIVYIRLFTIYALGRILSTPPAQKSAQKTRICYCNLKIMRSLIDSLIPALYNSIHDRAKEYSHGTKRLRR